MAQTRALSHPSVQGSWLEAAFRARLGRLEHGEIVLGAERYGRRTARCPLSARVEVRDARFYAEAAFGGSVGAGESYMRGDWSADDLTALMRILLANREVLDGMETGFARLAAALRKALHWAARNTRGGGRRNIAAHYDLGNEFFALFLDPTMTYSSAVFEHPHMSLERAQVAKLERICRRLELQPGEHVVEIGGGRGGFALHAARRYGCLVTTTTVSREQFEYAREQVERARLERQVSVLLEDYRDLSGSYDKLVSIEMIEAVGHHYYDAYFRKCSELLAPHGAMLLQAIVIDERRYAAARDSVDFIKRHIFPGCCIPSVAVISDAVARVTDLRFAHLEDLGRHYATTLRSWRENLFANLERVRALGYAEEFVRMWEFYLCYCEAGFAEHATGVVQALLAKPCARL